MLIMGNLLSQMQARVFARAVFRGLRQITAWDATRIHTGSATPASRSGAFPRPPPVFSGATPARPSVSQPTPCLAR